jgi:hypothetical protein
VRCGDPHSSDRARSPVNRSVAPAEIALLLLGSGKISPRFGKAAASRTDSACFSSTRPPPVLFALSQGRRPDA